MAKEERIAVLFIGECGSGKSTTINTILGEDVCEAGITLVKNGITKEVKAYPGILRKRIPAEEECSHEDSNDHKAEIDEDLSKEGKSEDNEDNQNDVENKGSAKDNDHRVDKDKNQKSGNEINRETEGNKNERTVTQLSDIQASDKDITTGKVGDLEPKSSDDTTKSDNLSSVESDSRKHPRGKDNDRKRKSSRETSGKARNLRPKSSNEEKCSDEDSKDQTNRKAGMDEDVSKDGNSEDIEDNQNDVENKGNTKDKDHDVHKDKNQNKGNKINQKTEGNRNEPNDTQLSDMQGAEDDMPSKQKHDKWRYEEIPVTLYDTPLFDEVLGDKSINSRGFHAIGLLLPLTRLTEERKKFFKQVSEAFDGKLSQYTIIIFTHSENQGGIDEIKKEVNLANDKHLNDLITKSGDRCVLFDPTRNKDEMALEFTEKLMDVVDNTSHEQIHLQKESFGKVMFKRLRLT